MKKVRRCRRILILSLVFVSVFTPVAFLSSKLGSISSSSAAGEEFVNDISGIRQSSNSLRLKSIEQDEGEGVKEPERLVLEDRGESTESENKVKDLSVKGNDNASAVGGLSSGVSDGLQNDTGEVGELLLQNSSATTTAKVQEKTDRRTNGKSTRYPGIQPPVDENIREIKDQLILANAYLHFSPPNSNSHLVRELKLRIREMERVLGHASKDKDLSRSALQRKRAMTASLEKARAVYPDCSALATKLRSMTYNSEEQLRAQKSQASYLIQLASRTFPKGLHCLSMRLTAEYFALQPAERELGNKKSVKQANLYHYAIFSDNVLACAVVVNSTTSKSLDPRKIVFHVVTDALNYPAMKMWFLLHPPGQATIKVENMDDFNWLSSGYISMVKQHGVKDLRYGSVLNHLRFYLPKIFPYLDKILLLDHDVVVQRDLSGLWKVDMKGKVIGAVDMLGKGDSFHRLEALVDFTDPVIANKIDHRECTWTFGVNILDLKQWRKLGLTSVYHKWLQQKKTKGSLLAAGTLPLGLLTFYNHTLLLDKRWHLLGLGYDSGISRLEIEKAAIIHYDGNMKPWLEISIPKYKGYWNKYVDYEHPYLQQCNIHE